MGLRTVIGDARRQFLSSVARREARMTSERPLISFTFDDFPKTALFTAGAMLESLGISATFYAAAGLMGSTTEVGAIFDEGDLRTLIEHGHELASHTYSHISAKNTKLSAYYEDVKKGEQALARYTANCQRMNFSYPFGAVTVEAKKKVGPAVRSCRGIFPGLDGSFVDLNLLHANSLYGGTERLSAVQSLIEENARRNTWLIFYTHDVQEKPSPYGCTPGLFECVVRCAMESGAEIVTIEKALDRIQ